MWEGTGNLNLINNHRGRTHVIGEDLTIENLHMGRFDVLPYEVIVEILTYLSTNDVHAMELTCRGMQAPIA